MSPSEQPNTETSFPREELKSMAVKQRRVLTCILCYLILAICYMAFSVFPLVLRVSPGEPKMLIDLIKLCLLATWIVSAVFVFMLGIRLYGTALGVLLDLLTFIPVIGLLVLLIVNGKATRTLKAGGLRVGLMGANLSQFKSE